MNYADQAVKFFALEKQEQIGFDHRKADLLERAERQIDGRIRHYPKHMRDNRQLLIATLHNNLCEMDLQLTSHLENQRHYLRLAQAYTVFARFLGHQPTGAVHAN